MNINNQCKIKQIKQKKIISQEKQKKIKNKDLLYNHINNHHKLNSQQKKKSNFIQYHQQYLTTNKFKQKNINIKNTQQQYYIKQKQINKNKKQSQYQKKYIKINSISSSKKNYQKSQHFSHKKNHSIQSNLPKLKFHDQKVVINFDGKMIKIPANNHHSKTHNFTQIQKSQYTSISPQFTNLSKNKKCNKNKSKSKKLKKSQSGYSIDLQLQNTNRTSTTNQYQQLIKPNWDGLEEQFKYKTNLLSEQTQVSPLRQYKQYQRNEIFDIQQIFSLIQEDLNLIKQIKLPQHPNIHRKDVIKMLSQLSDEIKLRHETFHLAINIFDRSILKNINETNCYLVAFVCLVLAIKLEQSQLSIQVTYILQILASNKDIHLDNIENNKLLSKTIEQQHVKSKKYFSKYKSSKKCQYSCKISQNNLIKIFKLYHCHQISKPQFFNLQQKITTQLNFNLWKIQPIYWADLLTCMWDQRMMNEEVQKNMHSTSLLFRYPPSLTNLSYLYQILEMAYTSDSIYRFPSIYIVLSIMYLLIRISKQSIQNGFQFYRKSLVNSTNILFLDTTGINHLFSNFIQMLKVQMLDIFTCCQFVSQFFHSTLFNDLFVQQNGKFVVDTDLFIHHFNPDIYKDIIS